MEKLLQKQRELSQHPVYQTFNDIKCVQHFMRYHVYAVWDFMSLLKSLQKHITSFSVPWRPSKYPADMVRMVNQIVLGEESDVDQAGKVISHFDLYLRAMEEIGASTSEIHDFIATLDLSRIPMGAQKFVAHNLDVAMRGHVVEVAANFLYGREKLVPEMFQSIVTVLEKEKIEAPTFLYYLKRHIEVDAHEHGPLAMKCLELLINDNHELQVLAETAGLAALEKREQLWDEVLKGPETVSLRFLEKTGS